MKGELFLGMAGVGMLMAGGAGVWLYLSSRKEGGDQLDSMADLAEKLGPERLSLVKASELWTDTKIPLAKAAVIWIDTEQEKRQTPKPNLDREELAEFWLEHIEPRRSIHGARKTAIAAVLKMLDRDGDCPSVVRNPKFADAENGYDKDAFDYLAQIPLWRHSLHVAKEMMMRAGRETLVPDAILAGLSHDLGKIPAYHEKGYKTGDHPQVSAIVIAGMPEFQNLPNKQEIEKIVRSHHHMVPDNAMAVLLKDCDQIVRNQEIGGMIAAAVEKERAVKEAADEIEREKMEREREREAQKIAEIPAEDLPQVPDQTPPEEKPDNPLGNKSPVRDSGAPERTDVSWIDLDTLLEEIKRWINVVAQGRWGAVSMPDGLVYVQQSLVWNSLKKTAPDGKKPYLLAAEADEATKRSILFSTVWTLSEQRNAIAADMMLPTYYAIKTTVIKGDNKPDHGNTLLIPFRSEGFNALPSELEAIKTENIKKLVKTIKPKLTTAN